MANKTWVGTTSAYSTASNWSPSGVPTNSDSVRIPAGSGDIAGYDASGVTLVDFIIDEGYSGTIGSSSAYLQITLSGRFETHSTGTSYIDLKASAVSPQVYSTAQAAPGYHGLYLKGSAIATLAVMGGNVGVAAIFGETATVTTARVVGGNLSIGSGTTLTTFQQTGGDNLLEAAATTVTIYGGDLLSRGVGAITTMNVYGGEVLPESTGTITTLLIQGGSVDFTQHGSPRTVTNLKHNSGELNYDPNVLTITTRQAPDFPVSYTASLKA